MIRGFAIAALATICCAVSGAQAPAKAPASAPPAVATPTFVDPVPALLKSPADVARGKAIFVGTCGAYCHKMTSMHSDAPYLFDCEWLHGGSSAEIFHTITHGVAGTRMVSFAGAIADEDLWRIVAYLKSASECKS